MTLPEFIGAFGETGLFAGLALFIIWFLVKREERNEAKLEAMTTRFAEEMARKDERFTATLSALTDKFTAEIAKHREELIALRLSLKVAA